MNMFRNLFTLALFALAVALFLTDPTKWDWAAALGPYVVNTLWFLGQLKPFSYILLLVLAVALFITRKQY